MLNSFKYYTTEEINRLRVIVTRTLCDWSDQRNDIIAIYLFGSIIKGQMHSESDIDIGILFQHSTNFNWEKKIKLSVDLTDISGHDADIILMNIAPDVLQMQILKYGKCIYIRDKKMQQNYIMTSCSRYSDFIISRRSIVQSLKQRTYGRS